MIPALVIAVVIALIAGGYLLLMNREGGGLKLVKGGKDAEVKKPWPYRARVLMTEREQVMFHRLREACPELLVFSQVQLSRAIEVKPRVDDHTSWRNKIDRKSLDFVICLPDSSILAVIELDDKSHDRQKQKTRDADKTRALADAGVRLIRVNEIPSVSALCGLLGRTPPAPTATNPPTAAAA